jgi:hypothetical protein
LGGVQIYTEERARGGFAALRSFNGAEPPRV